MQLVPETAAPALPSLTLPGPERKFPATTVCDLGTASAFSHDIYRPHAPVLAAFGGNSLHKYVRTDGWWDLERAVADAPEALLRSVRYLDAEKQKEYWDDLTFRCGPRAFLYAVEGYLIGYAETAPEAERLVRDFARRYAKAPPASGGRFHLIRTGHREISTEPVPLEAATVLTPEAFALHYGEEGQTWHRGFAGQLCAANRGLCILEGSPGTGKTSYLRHLMGELRDTHRFYFIPPATLDVLSSPDFIGFWAEQRRRHEKEQFVVVLEDAEAALMPRSGDNRNQVSAILNLSDGMLADFLRLEIICTINGRAADIDPALLRPGRLLCHRVFERMDAERARRLAGHLGRRVPSGRGGENFSLAEVYAAGDEPQTMPTRPRLGFAA